MVIAVDFDGTLFSNNYPNIGEPNNKVIEWCKQRKRCGDTLILWTCRSRKRLKAAVDACKKFGLEFDYINNHTKESIKRYGRAPHGSKILADVYLDDKSMLPNDITNNWETKWEFAEKL